MNKTKMAVIGANGWVPLAKLLVASFFLCYVAMRIFKLPLGPDEWGVLSNIHEHGFVDWIHYRDWNSQNHFLHLIFAKLCLLIVPQPELIVIRIPGLIALVFYEWAAWKICDQIHKRFLSLAALTALLACPFLLDYFGLSRSYGPAMAFTLWSLFGLVKVLAAPGQPVKMNQGARLAIWSAFLAVMSSLVFLPLYTTVLTVLLVIWGARWWKRQETPSRNFMRDLVMDNLHLIVSAVILAAFCAPRLIYLQQRTPLGGDGVPGGKNGLISDTVMTLVKTVCYDLVITTSAAKIIAWVIVILIVLMGLTATVIGVRNGDKVKGAAVVAGLFFYLVTAALVLVGLHLVLHAKYPMEGRTVLYLIPGFVLLIAFFADAMPLRCFQWPSYGLLLVWISVGVWNLNFSHVWHCEVYCDIPLLIQELKAYHIRTGKPVVLCISDGFKWSVWYYGEKMVGLRESDRLRDYVCQAKINWLEIDEVYCGKSPDGTRTLLMETTHLFVGPEDEPIDWAKTGLYLGNNLILDDGSLPKLAAQLPNSKFRLYTRE